MIFLVQVTTAPCNLVYLIATGGRINLLPSSVNTIQGSGTSQLLEYTGVVNFGYVEYYPTGIGVRVQLGASFVNAFGIFLS